MFVHPDIYHGELPTSPICEKCGSQIPESIGYRQEHEMYCEYIWFVNKVAPARDLHSLAGLLTREEAHAVAEVFETLKVPHQIWDFSGLGGFGQEVWAPQEMEMLIKIFKQRGGFAEMNLEEFVRKAVGDAYQTGQ